MMQVSAPQRVRDAWMKAEGLEILGKKLDAQEAVQIVVGLAGGMKGEAKIIEVPAYVCMTKAKKQVTVTTTEAMKIIIENGGEFLSETTKEIKL